MKRMSVDEIRQRAEELKTAIELKSPDEIEQAMKVSMRGFSAVLLGEKAFRTDLVVFFLACVAVGVMRFAFHWISWAECALMIYVVFMALIAEIINTAIETTIDRVSTDYHELSRRAKDIGSAIVFVAFFGAGLVWFIILLGVSLRLFS